MPEKKREGFTFYWSFYEYSLEMDLEEQKEFIREIVEYALLGKEPETDNKYLKLSFKAIRNNLDSAIRKFDQRRANNDKKKKTDSQDKYQISNNKYQISNNTNQSRSDSEEVPNNDRTCSEDSIITLPLNGKTQFKNIYEGDLTYYSGLYPNVDILQEFRNMLGWLNANPSRRKTARGIDSFINSWLCKKQDQGRKPDNRHETESFSPSEIVNLGREMERYE